MDTARIIIRRETVVITDKTIEKIKLKLKENIALINSLGFNKISLNDYYTSIVKIVSDLKKEPNNDKWTPMSEGSPKDGYYLVSCKGGHVHIDFCLRGEWYNKYHYEILAWRPKPESYKG